MEKQLTVIIGAGPSGLAAAKYAKQAAINFVVLERYAQIGGVWNPQTGLVWKNMHTNISRNNSKYSDFPWPFQPQIFPTNQEFFAYLQAYVDHHGIMEHIIFNCEVQEVKQLNESKGYFIRSKQKGQIKEYIATNVVIASGLFSQTLIPDVPGLDQFQGEIHDSRSYKSGENFKGKRMLVVGGSFTGIELASDLSLDCQIVYHSYREQFMMATHFIKTSPQSAQPIDLLFYRRNPNLKKPVANKTREQHFQTQSRLVEILCKEQQEIPSLKINQQNLYKPMALAISSGYLKSVKSGKIIPKKNNIKKFNQHSVVLGTGEQIQIDAIMFCTGCKPSLNYLSPQIKEIIQCQPFIQKHPVVMYKNVMHPKLEGMYFAGIYRGILIPICEIQARFAIAMITGSGTKPTQEQIEEDIKVESQYRKMGIFTQNRYPIYPEYCDFIAPHLGIINELEKLKNENPELFAKFISLPLIQQQKTFSTEDLQQQIQTIQKAIKDSTIKIQQ